MEVENVLKLVTYKYTLLLVKRMYFK